MAALITRRLTSEAQRYQAARKGAFVFDSRLHTRQSSSSTENPNARIALFPTAADLMSWDAILTPDEHTPYVGSKLLLSITIPSKYV
jgi:ubiquitin-protein ligase